MKLYEARDRLVRAGYALTIQHEPHPEPDTRKAWRHDLFTSDHGAVLLVCSNHSEGRWALNCWTFNQARSAVDGDPLVVQFEQSHASYTVTLEDLLRYLVEQPVVDASKQWAHYVVKIGFR